MKASILRWIYAENVYWNHSYYTYMMWHHILDTQNPVRIQEIFPVSTITFFLKVMQGEDNKVYLSLSEMS